MSDNPFGEIPALPVALVVGAIALLIQLLLLLRGGRFTWPRAIVAGALAVYAAGIFANTVLPISLNRPPQLQPWTPKLALIPFSDYEVMDAITNVIVFAPLGILIPLLIRRPSWAKVVLTAAAISLAIELLQIVTDGLFGGGHVADVNDFLWNTVGGAVGYAIFLVVSRTPGLSRLVELFRWHPATRSTRIA
ncbi:VanZ family protein [Curtobacterium sp. VKM Ac-1395]|uniref:VanZ family protein n=1 Tax=Curtobacterium sp. VKM Ac-1395 TaxID=2783815 RepID=UPI00188B48CE|nr:VanZ family protein [Curtobacterium sp. VKM Ac-1395]MBF4588704.1 VanZ family protein [Curtobacterium sp. VKM Ac-1395]